MRTVKDTEREKRWRKANPVKFAAHQRRYQLKTKYKLSPEQYDKLLAGQNGHCALCDKVDYGWGRGKGLVLDHCHKTGRVRGFVCHKCNVGLSRFEDSIDLLQKAIDYLNSH